MEKLNQEQVEKWLDTKKCPNCKLLKLKPWGKQEWGYAHIIYYTCKGCGSLIDEFYGISRFKPSEVFITNGSIAYNKYSQLQHTLSIEEFDEAIEMIKYFLYLNYDDTRYKVAKTTTNSYEEFKKETLRNGYITISSEGCTDTIYKSKYNTGEDINILARLWHDKWHYFLDLDFSFENEVEVCKYQLRELRTFYEAFSGSQVSQRILKNIEAIIKVDIIGQAMYYEDTKKFLINQKEFVMKVLNGTYEGEIC